MCREPLARLCGGRTDADRRAALREYTEQPLRQGAVESPWERLVAGVVLGTEAFARRLRQEVQGNSREQAALKRLARPMTWERIVSALEVLKGERWEAFVGRHGDWGRDAALWLGRWHGRLTLSELGRLAGGMDYGAVGQAVSRLGKRLEREPELKAKVRRLERAMLIVEM